MPAQPADRSASRRARLREAHESDVRLDPPKAVLAGATAGLLAIAAKALIAVEFDADPGYILLFGAVVGSAWVGALTAGLVAIAVTTVLNVAIFVVPSGSLVPGDRDGAARLVLYVVVAIVSAALIGSRRASRDRLADALGEVASLAAAIEQRDERLEFMLAASGTGFWEWDIVSGDLEWSEAIFQQHGLDPAAGAPDYEAYIQTIHPEDRERFQDALRSAIDRRAPFNLDFRILWPDGSVHWTHGAARLILDGDGRPVRMLGTGQDITERRRVEDERDELLAEERRVGAYRESFIDVVSHELRTPITTILGLSQILTKRGTRDSEVDRGLMEDVRAESERLYRLVEDLLVLSRVEHRRLVVDAEPLEPRRVLSRLVENEAAELRSVELSLDITQDLPVVAGEVTYVEQIVRNLLGNAAKYSPPGSKVVVSARREGEVVAIRVIDDGPGVPPESIDRIFELFYRDPERARTVAGSGIGLFVCASLVEAMGGRIWALRRPEGGSEFGFTLRVIEPDAREDSEPAPAASRT